MAWTNPKSWSVGETLTAANFNAQIRDNFNVVGPMVHVIKTADESVTSSTALQDDDHLFFSIGVSESWVGHLALATSGGSAGDFSFALNAPTGATGSWTYMGVTTAGTTVKADGYTGTSIWVDGNTGATDTPSSVPNLVLIHFGIINSTTAGTFKLRWAQFASSGTATIVRTGSHLLAWKV